MDQLIQQDFINEGRYAGFYVRDKVRFNKWGPTKIIWNLRQKGLPEEAIQDALDRKSTRLNSSHVRISYAVFCLKKKKNYTIHRLPTTTCIPEPSLPILPMIANRLRNFFL